MRRASSWSFSLFSRTTRHAALVVLAIGWLGGATSSPARAQEEPSADERARARFESGRAHYDAGRVPEALADFEAAFELSRRPALLYNVYLCRLDLGDVEQAVDALRRYLAEASVEQTERTSLEARLVELERRVALRARAVAPERVRSRREAPTPPRVLELDTGDDRGTNVAAWALVSSGAVAMVTGVVLLAIAQSDIDEVADGTRWSEVSGSYRRAPVASGVGLGALGAGLAALGTGTAWLVVETP
ncbi:MAG: tetratricopeptide repeat protein [Deltaproteobacteria bacterium]|nr:tetratricopeptide repeat protein [Deltaproteobacteria bacterium]